VRFGGAESVLAEKTSLLGEISTWAVVPTTCRSTTCVLTTCRSWCLGAKKWAMSWCLGAKPPIGVLVFRRGKLPWITGFCGRNPPSESVRRALSLERLCSPNPPYAGVMVVRELFHNLGTRRRDGGL